MRLKIKRKRNLQRLHHSKRKCRLKTVNCRKELKYSLVILVSSSNTWLYVANIANENSALQIRFMTHKRVRVCFS